MTDANGVNRGGDQSYRRRGGAGGRLQVTASRGTVEAADGRVTLRLPGGPGDEAVRISVG